MHVVEGYFKEPLFTNDFIVIAEFCEQRGPVALNILPNEKAVQNFDLNRFVVRILASDHTRKIDPRGMNGGWTSPEDSQVCLSDSKQGAHAYVHHVTLKDVSARGYVRPLCLCYITRDNDKIMTHFEQLLFMFTKISMMMKFGNNCTFISDVLDQISNLAPIIEENEKRKMNPYLQHAQERGGDDEEEEDEMDEEEESNYEQLKEVSQEAFNAVLKDLEMLKNTFSAYLTEYERQFVKTIEDSLSLITYASSLIPNGTNTSFAPAEMIVNQLQSMGTPNEFLHAFLGGLNISSKLLQTNLPILLRCIHKSSNYESRLRDPLGICGKVFETARHNMNLVLEYFNRPSIAMELEKYDLQQMVTHDLPSQLFLGKSFVLNFDIQQEAKHDYHHGTLSATSSYQDLSTTGTSAGSSWKEHAMEDPTPTELGHQAASSPHGFMARAAANGSKVLPPSINMNTVNSSNAGGLDNTKNPTLIRNAKALSSCFVSQIFYNEILEGSVTLSKLYSNSTTGSSNSQGAPSFPGRGMLRVRDYYSFSKEIAFSLLIGRLVVIHAHPENEAYVRDLICTLSLFIPGQSWVNSDYLHSLHPNSQSNSTYPPSSNLFSDNYSDKGICFWRGKDPISVKDLSSLRIIGLSKKIQIPKSIMHYITKLDVERDVLNAPEYKGGETPDQRGVLDKIFDRSKTWPDEETYLAYIHSVFLNLGSNAMLLYHLHCIGSINRPLTTLHTPTPATPAQSIQRPGSSSTPQPTNRSRGRSISNPTESPKIWASAANVSSPASASSSSETPTAPKTVIKTGLSIKTPRPPISPTAVASLSSSTATPVSPSSHSPSSFANSSSFPTPSNYPSGSPDIVSVLNNIEYIKDGPRYILKRLGVRNSDIHIVQYLAEIITEQQTRTVLDQLPETIRLVTHKTVVFTKNSQKKK